MSKLAQRLQRVIKRDIGIEVSEPEERNRGYWATNGLAYRWCATGADGVTYWGWPSMAECAKHGVILRKDKNDGEMMLESKGHWRDFWGVAVIHGPRISD